LKQEDLSSPLIALVGPCGSGKTTLARGLKERGYRVRQVAQEHSYVQHMWQHITNPDILIYLDASFAVCTQRKKLNWQAKDHIEQLRRLAHARENCDFIIATDEYTPTEVLHKALENIPDGHSFSRDV
jgi:thymidylate kinase